MHKSNGQVIETGEFEGIINPKIILFADGGTDAARLERLIVDTWEIPVVLVTELDAGIRAFHQMHPDLVIVDHKDAARLLHEFREDRAPEAFLPTLVLISEDDHGEKQQDMLAGAADFLTKPIDPVDALLRIHNLLSLREARLQLQDRSNQEAEDILSARIRALRQQLTRLHAREHTLTQQHRLQALGTMASGVAHDFNNVLSVVIGFAEQLLREDQQVDLGKRREWLKNILIAAEDGAGMVHRLREFSRPSDSHEVRRPVDLNEIIDQSVTLTKPRWSRAGVPGGEQVRVQRDPQPLPPVAANAAELREMLTNLIFNAVDAMPHGGTVHLRTWVEAGRAVMEVRDTGTGMSDRTRRKCLEPFFTTKGEKGTGMGLAMVHGIVTRHGATMELESEPGRGTSFRFHFPVVESAAGTVAQADPVAAGPLRVLVVDDEPIIAELMGEMLKHEGHEVSIATDPRDAFKRAMTQPLDLVITDKSMPMMDGADLAVMLKSAFPNIRIMLVTGLGTNVQVGEAIDHVVGKPLTIDSLRKGIAKTLEAKIKDDRHAAA